MKKQVLSLALSATMLASMLPKPAFAADNTIPFPDMPNDWSTQALQSAINNGLLNGIDGKIAAGENLTRAQMAAIVTRAFGTNGKANISSFGDVNAGDWFYDAMASSVLMGAFQGDGVNLNPNANITRQEAFTVLARLFTLSGGDQSVLSSYTDGAQVADWAKDSMASMVAAGYVKGSDNMLNPRSSITRAEFAQVMDNLVKTYFADNRLNVNANGNAVLNKAGTLEGATISGDLIIGDGAAEGDVVLKDVTVSGRLLVRGGGTSTVTLGGNTTVGSIAVNKPTGAVRVKNNTQKTVNVNALSDNVVLTGDFNEVNANASQGTVTLTGADVATMNVAGTSAKVVVSEKSTVETMNVQGSASGAAVSVQSGTNVNTMNTAASKAVVTVNGTVNTMSVAGSDTTVKAEEGAKVEKITTSAANTTVSGKGSVANFEAAKGSSGADITTDGTKVVNNGTGNVTTGNDKVIASGSTGASKSDSTGTTTPGGSTGGGSTGGGSVVVSSDVVVAPMADHAAKDAIPSENLCSSYSASGTVNGDVHTVKITAKDVMNHTNAADAEGHWVGFGIPAAKGNTYYAGFGSVPADLGSPVSSIAERTYEVNGKTYNTVYFSGDAEDEYKNGAYVVVKNGDKTTTYNITFDVSFFKAKVSVVTDIPEGILDDHGEDSRKTAKVLGLDAVTNGTTVTLSGETTTDKLDATDTETQNGYLLYGFNVGSKLITQLGGSVTPDPMSLTDLSKGGTVLGADSMNNAALLNIQIWDNGKSSFIKKTISVKLKDAAGRVQDTVELTVDATGCKIESQHSVTFKDAVDGKVIQSISVANNGTVTPPSKPSKEGFKFLGWYSDENTEFTAGTPVTADMTVYAKWENIIEAVNNAKDKSALQTVLETEGNADVLGIAVSSGDYSNMAVSRKPSVANYVLESKPEGGYTTAAEIQAAFNMGVKYEAGKWALSEKIKENASTVSDFNTLKGIYGEHAAYRASIGKNVSASEVYTDAMKAFDRVNEAIIAKVHEKFADEDNNAGDSEFTNPYKLNSVFDYIIACAPETVDEVNTALGTEKMNLAEVTVKNLTVAEGETLTIPEGKKVIVNGDATLTLNAAVTGTIEGTSHTSKLVIGEGGSYNSLPVGTYIWNGAWVNVEDLKLKSVATDFGKDVSATVSGDGMSVVLSGTVPVDKLTYSAKTFTSQTIKLTVNGDKGKTADVKLIYTAETGEFSITSDSDTFEVDGTTYNVSAKNLFIAKTDVTPKARENGPAAPISDNNYNYKAAYGKAGVTFSGGINAISYTVDAAKLAGFCVPGYENDIKALTHKIGETNYLFVGIQFDTPDIAKNATQAMRYIDGKASTEEAFDLSVDGENAYKKNPMEYFTFGSYTVQEGDATTYAPVASTAKTYEVITYWMDNGGNILAVNFSTVNRTAPTNNN